MRYLSTRGNAPAARFDTILTAGLAPDGGLYVPERWPRLDDRAPSAGVGFAKAAAQLLAPYVAPWMARDELEAMTERAYAAFGSHEVAPLIRLGEDDFLLELFHGPTLAFKDVAMQLLAVLFERALEVSASHATIIGATSGDTGAAAIEAFRDKERIDVFILYPAGKISDVQRRIMTTAREENISVVAVDGTFDDCQRIVKALFADAAFADAHGLAGVNSINWARIAAQTVYYFTGLAALEAMTGARRASFAVPTGNFGDAFAGYAALKMGAAINRLALGVNRNDILHRALETGVYRPESVAPTTSPAMDIQVASNFERLLFEVSGRDAAAVAGLMRELDRRGVYEIPNAWLQAMREVFISARIDEGENRETIRRVHDETGITIDPHTAVGVAAARKLRADRRLKGPVIALATAHPAKFPDAVEAAIGERPALPPRYANLCQLSERIIEAPADAAAVQSLIKRMARC
ncbi:MAG TPA: threonine synthase [Parvularculaceae bacterium]|nr:threonine synthase [Parvularculaceae bacterium]